MISIEMIKNAKELSDLVKIMNELIVGVPVNEDNGLFMFEGEKVELYEEWMKKYNEIVNR